MSIVNFTEAVGVPNTKPTSLEAVLWKVLKNKQTGRLDLKGEHETVILFVENGVIQAITSNNIRQYCSGTPIPFNRIDPIDMQEAVYHQSTQGRPIFLTLRDQGLLKKDANIKELLRRQGLRTLIRHFGKALEVDFKPTPDLPPYVYEYPLQLAGRELFEALGSAL